MKYLFLFRRASDLDHITPIIYSLFTRGISHKQIIYTDYLIDRTAIGIEKDERIKFLKKNSIFFKQSYLINYYKLDDYLNKLIFSDNSLLKFFARITSVITLKYIHIHFFFKIFFYISSPLNKKTIIIDALSNKFLEYLTHKLNISLISVPHGIVFHNGDLKNLNLPNVRYLLPDLKKFKFYSKIFFYNDIALDVKKLNLKNLYILGSARYNEEWSSVQSRIYKSITNLFVNKKIIVLLLMEKKNNSRIYEDEIKKIINFFYSSSKYNLIIKFHPSFRSNKPIFKSQDNIKVIKSDKQFKTFQLVKYSNIVLGIKSGAICDAILQKKFFLILDHCHAYKLIIKDLMPSINITSSYEDFISKLSNYKKYKSDNKNFIQTYLNDKNNSVLDLYHKNITN